MKCQNELITILISAYKISMERKTNTAWISIYNLESRFEFVWKCIKESNGSNKRIFMDNQLLTTLHYVHVVCKWRSFKELRPGRAWKNIKKNHRPILHVCGGITIEDTHKFVQLNRTERYFLWAFDRFDSVVSVGSSLVIFSDINRLVILDVLS